MPEDNDPFFIGWEGEPAAAPVKHSKSRSLLFVLAALIIAGTAAALQTNFVGKGGWDFEEKSFEGVFLAEPYPTLISGDSVYYVALETKHGFPAEAAKTHHLKQVKITGSAIEDPDQPTSMIAVASPASVVATGGAAADPLASVSGGKRVTLRGEIADSKCALGAMSPGFFKPHRACAIACLSGGIPPVLIVRHGEGIPATHYLLVGADGKAANEIAIKHAALPVEITGKVTELGTWKILRASPGDIRPIE